MIKASSLAALKGVRHGFFTRLGGVSKGCAGDMDGLNCGFGSADSAENVSRNRALALARLGPAGELVTTRQVHSAAAVRVDGAWPREEAPEADAMAGATAGLVLGILSADCAPVLFADAASRVVGAAHAGWRGAGAGVLEACVGEMTALGAKTWRIYAAVGPCIGQASYQVGPEFRRRFVDGEAASEAFFGASERAGHFQFDLAGYVVRRLSKLGLASTQALAFDTCAEPERFYSYRRCVLDGERDYGRLLSAITLD